MAINSHSFRRKLPENVTKDQIRDFLDDTAGFTLKLAYKVTDEDMELLQNVLLDNRYNVENTMTYLAQPCDSFIVKCRFEGVMRDCKSLFRRVNTFRGYCCAFNVRGIAE